MRKFKKLKQKTTRRNRGHFFLQEHQNANIKALYENIRKHAKENNIICVSTSMCEQRVTPKRLTLRDFIPCHPNQLGVDMEYHMNNKPTDGSVVVKRMRKGGHRG